MVPAGEGRYRPEADTAARQKSAKHRSGITTGAGVAHTASATVQKRGLVRRNKICSRCLRDLIICPNMPRAMLALSNDKDS